VLSAKSARLFDDSLPTIEGVIVAKVFFRAITQHGLLFAELYKHE
jgi:hypothetical protein